MRDELSVVAWGGELARKAKRNRLRALAAVSAAAAVGAGLSLVSAPMSASAPDVPEVLRPFYDQQIAWGSCQGYVADFKPSPRTECAMVKVPVDYQNPKGEAAQVAVYRIKASGQKIGSLLFNPGGPGGSGVEFVAGSAPALLGKEIAQRFDLVGFDPRGIGHSTPSVHCLSDKEQDALRALNDNDYSPAGIARQEGRNRDYAQKCAQRTGANFLAHVNSMDVARDLDVLRQSLGDEKLNYVGYSYGTRIGTDYAALFPTHVRALVLDGALDPKESPVDKIVKQAKGFEDAFRIFAADCATQENCALGNDPAQADVKFRSLVLPLIEHPLNTRDGRGLGYSDAVLGTIQALYSKQLWTALREGLIEVKAGSGNILQLLSDLYMDRDAKTGRYSNEQDANAAVRCVDDPPIADRAVVDQMDVQGREAAPFEDDERGTGHAALDPCAFWPVRPTVAPALTGLPAGLPKVVVVSTTNDPATPYQAGVELAKQLGASLVTYNGTQHTVSLQGESQCVDGAVQRYLVDLVPPADGLTC
ncbi:MAG: alpha/beta hydrolase [Segniliparus sp.]|uniref:alpha/beta hydrolase n=1 Tax=Segniliparus sp. TaxID=2804064 RepID=UPI003F2AD790